MLPRGVAGKADRYRTNKSGCWQEWSDGSWGGVTRAVLAGSCVWHQRQSAGRALCTWTVCTCSPCAHHQHCPWRHLFPAQARAQGQGGIETPNSVHPHGEDWGTFSFRQVVSSSSLTWLSKANCAARTGYASDCLACNHGIINFFHYLYERPDICQVIQTWILPMSRVPVSTSACCCRCMWRVSTGILIPVKTWTLCVCFRCNVHVHSAHTDLDFRGAEKSRVEFFPRLSAGV